MVHHQFEKRGRIEPRLFWHDHEFAAGQPRGKQLLERDVEAGTGKLKRPCPAPDDGLATLPGNQIGDGTDRHLHALRDAGRPRGEKDVGEVVVALVVRHLPRRLGGDFICQNTGVDPHGARSGPLGRNRVAERLDERGGPAVGHDERTAGNCHHRCESFRGQRRIERHAAGLRHEHAKDRGLEFGRARQADPDRHAFGRARVAKPRRNLLAMRVQFTVGPTLRPPCHGDGIGGRLHLITERLEQATRRG